MGGKVNDEEEEKERNGKKCEGERGGKGIGGKVSDEEEEK